MVHYWAGFIYLFIFIFYEHYWAGLRQQVTSNYWAGYLLPETTTKFWFG